MLGNGIPDTCDPTPTELTSAPGGQPIDHDGDGFANSGDNYPTLYNPDQLDTDVKVGDGIGDVCDTPGLDGGTDCVGEGCTGGIPRPIPPANGVRKRADVPDGSNHICVRTRTIVACGSNQATGTPTPSVRPTSTPPTTRPS